MVIGIGDDAGGDGGSAGTGGVLQVKNCRIKMKNGRIITKK